MTPTEAAYAKGIRDAREMAMIAAVTIEIEVRIDRPSSRQAGGVRTSLPVKGSP